MNDDKRAGEEALRGSRLAYARSAVNGRLSPEQLTTGAHRTLARYKHLLDDLPVGLSRALRRASEGEFHVAVRPSDYDRLLDRLHRDASLFTVLLAALVIGSSVIVALRPGNAAADGMGETILAIAPSVAVCWMIACCSATVAADAEPDQRARRVASTI